MEHYFYVPKNAVIWEDKLVKGKGFEYEYIIYENVNRQVHVNTYYNKTENGFYKCCIYYDRKICNKIEDLASIPIYEIENQIYGSFMDGAR